MKVGTRITVPRWPLVERERPRGVLTVDYVAGPWVVAGGWALLAAWCDVQEG